MFLKILTVMGGVAILGSMSLVQASEMTRPSRLTANSSAAPERAVDPDSPRPGTNHVSRPGAYIHSCRSNRCGTLGGGTATGDTVVDSCYFPGQVLEGSGRWHYVTDNYFRPSVSGWVHELWLMNRSPGGDKLCWS
jgi:hypothetical protein